MIGLKHTGRGLMLVILLLVVLAACGGGGEKKSEETQQPAPGVSPLPPEWTPTPGEGPGPVNPETAAGISPTNTPFVPPPEPVFQDAAELARADLSARLSIAPDRIDVLESDASLFLGEPVECPVLADEFQDVYYVYLQYERNIYPYQAYQSEETGTVVEACADVLVDQEVLFIPTPDVRATLVELIRADLAARGVDATNGEFQTVRAVTWTDTALGCRTGPDQKITSAVIDGYLIVYVVGGVSYEYHTDATGERIDYCAPPAGYESVEAFIAALQADKDLEVRVVRGEAAAYNGLDARGTLIEMTEDAWRVGVFGFASNTAARAAAQQIDAAGVSHIFVSGSVLVVQEENDPIVYSRLLSYAEEVRTPLLEEEAQPGEEYEESDEYGEAPTPGG